MRPSGSWVAIKLDYLQRYIDIFTTSMRKKWTTMHYVDLFAGPGKCRVKNAATVHLGSPVVALTAKNPFSGYYFVDLDARNVEALKRRCAASSLAARVKCIVGDSNVIVDRIVAQIQSTWPSLNLAFLDPSGLELCWQTVVALSCVRRMDLIIYYPHLGLNFNMKQAMRDPRETKVDRFFGGGEWRSIHEDWERRGRPKGLHRLLIDLYKRKLTSLGYREVLRGSELGDEPLIRSSGTGGPLYYLLFASKHPLGLKFWQDVNRRDVYGQRRMNL